MDRGAKTFACTTRSTGVGASQIVRPGRHGRDRRHAWVYTQDRVWVDYYGTEHDVCAMRLNQVVQAITYIDASTYELVLLLSPALSAETLDEMVEAVGRWIEELPIVCALRGKLRQLTQLQRGCAPAR